jgi:uncharacterized protein (DUF1800 family)
MIVMAIDPQTEAALALHRFGFGPRGDAIVKIASDPRGALLAELERPGAGAIDNPDLLTSAEAAQAGRDFRQVRKAARLAERIEHDANQQSARQAAAARQAVRNNRNAGADGTDMQMGADMKPPSKGGGVAQLAGAYEREAIRPHVLGRFADMLLAVESHPAMLLYLDNARSIGPNSPAGHAGGKGLNENLAREILELHTLGVRTVYSQADVTRFADVITGWTVVPARPDLPHAGEFAFNARMHEPAPQQVIGKTYPDTGFEQGRAVLQALARHPATAKHVATKLARHFVADDPPLTLVDKLAKRFLDTQGNLNEVAKVLIAAPESWASPARKLKRPGEWIVGIWRATGTDPSDIRPILQAQNLLGEPLWRPPAPNGFADQEAAWIDGMAQRLDVATQAARRLGGQLDPKAVLDAGLGPLASAETRQTINRAESRPQALALLFMAPEFQRR